MRSLKCCEMLKIKQNPVNPLVDAKLAEHRTTFCYTTTRQLLILGHKWFYSSDPQLWLITMTLCVISTNLSVKLTTITIWLPCSRRYHGHLVRAYQSAKTTHHVDTDTLIHIVTMLLWCAIPILYFFAWFYAADCLKLPATHDLQVQKVHCHRVCPLEYHCRVSVRVQKCPWTESRTCAAILTRKSTTDLITNDARCSKAASSK